MTDGNSQSSAGVAGWGARMALASGKQTVVDLEHGGPWASTWFEIYLPRVLLMKRNVWR